MAAEAAEGALAGEGVEEEALSLRDCLLDLGEAIDPFSLLPGVLSFKNADGAPVTVAAIPVTVIEDRCLVAVPHSTWNKATARRRLPKQALTRAAHVEVAAQGSSPGAAHTALKVKVWLGFLAQEFDADWGVGGGEEAQFPFRVAGSQSASALPHFAGLLQASQEQFGYETGWSGGGLDGEMEEPDGLEDRVVAIERSLGALQKGLDRLLEQTSPTPAAPAVQASRPQPGLASAAAPVPPGLDPSTVAEARRAGIPEAQLRLLSELASKPNKMLDGRGGRTGGRKVGPLSESEEEAPDAGGAGLAIEESSLPPVERAVVQMSAVLQKLSRKQEKSRGGPGGSPRPCRGLGVRRRRRIWIAGGEPLKSRRLSAPLPVAERRAGSDGGVHLEACGGGLYRIESGTRRRAANSHDAGMVGASVPHPGSRRAGEVVMGGGGHRGLPGIGSTHRGPCSEPSAPGRGRPSRDRFRELAAGFRIPFRRCGPSAVVHSPSWSRSSRTTAHADPGSQVDSCGHVACPREGGFCRSAAKVGRRVWAASSWLRCHLQRSDREGGEARERSTQRGQKKAKGQ